MHRVSRKKDRTGSTVEQKRKATYSWRRENSKKRALCHCDDKHFRKYEYHRSQHLGVKQMTPSSPAGFHGLCTGRVYTRPLEHETKQEKGKEQNLCIAILTQPAVNISILNKNNATCSRLFVVTNRIEPIPLTMEREALVGKTSSYRFRGENNKRDERRSDSREKL